MTGVAHTASQVYLLFQDQPQAETALFFQKTRSFPQATTTSTSVST